MIRSCHFKAALLLVGIASCALPLAARAQTPSPGATSTTASADSVSTDASLAPTTDPPWNPPRPAPRAEVWERVLRFPGQVATLPLSAMGIGLEKLLLDLESRRLIKYAAPPRTRPPSGLVLGPISVGARSGLGFHLGGPPEPAVHWMRADFTGNTRRFEHARLLLFKGPFGVEARQEWRPEQRFFGLGLDAQRGNQTDYTLQRASARVLFTWPTLHAVNNADTLRARRTPAEGHGFAASTWLGSRTQVVRSGHRRGLPSFETLFPELIDQRDVREDNLIWGASASYDDRQGIPHFARGGLLEAVVERADKPVKALAFTSARNVGVPWTRITADGQYNVSFMHWPRTFRFTGRVSHLETADGGGVLLLPDLVTLGAEAGLAGFEADRFADRDLALGRVDYLFPIAAHVEFDVHHEWGGVYPDVRHDLALRTLEHSWGVFARVRSENWGIIGTLGVDHARDGIRFSASLGGHE